MDGASIASIIIAVVAGIFAVASNRSAGKAAVLNTTVSERMEAEREAYVRARQFDTETINRQNQEIDDLRDEVSAVRRDNRELREALQVSENKVAGLQRRVQRLELYGYGPHTGSEKQGDSLHE